MTPENLPLSDISHSRSRKLGILDLLGFWVGFHHRDVLENEYFRKQGLQPETPEPTMTLVTQDESERLLQDLRKWTSAKHGRQVEIARAIGTSKQKVSDWLSGRVKPGVRWHFEIRRFLDERN